MSAEGHHRRGAVGRVRWSDLLGGKARELDTGRPLASRQDGHVRLVSRSDPPRLLVPDHDPRENPLPRLSRSAVPITVPSDGPLHMDQGYIRLQPLYLNAARRPHALLEYLCLVTPGVFLLDFGPPLPMISPDIDELGICCE